MTTLEIVSLVLGSNVVTTTLTIYANRTIRKSERVKNEAAAADLLAKTYSSLIKDLNTQIENLKNLNRELSESKEQLIRDINDLEVEVGSLRKQVTNLLNRLRKYEKKSTE